jgi:hypothetical protein
MFTANFKTQYSNSEFSVQFDGEKNPVKYFLNGKNITKRVEASAWMERVLISAADHSCDLNYLLVHSNTN